MSENSDHYFVSIHKNLAEYSYNTGGGGVSVLPSNLQHHLFFFTNFQKTLQDIRKQRI